MMSRVKEKIIKFELLRRIEKVSKNFKKTVDKRDETMYIIRVAFEGQHFIAELCKGSTADSDSVCLGSNPSSATKTEQAFACSVFLLPAGFEP